MADLKFPWIHGVNVQNLTILNGGQHAAAFGVKAETEAASDQLARKLAENTRRLPVVSHETRKSRNPSTVSMALASGMK